MKTNQTNKIKTAVILCGGKGTRLGQLGKKIPKTLVRIHKRPIIWYIIKTLYNNSFNHFILPLGYKSNLIRKYFKNNKEFKNYNIELVNTGLETNISKRIYDIKDHIKSKDFILLNGDAIFNFNLKKIFKKHNSNNFDITFMGCSAHLNFGIVGKKNNKIVSFERDVEIDTVNTGKRKNFLGHIYSGISIMKSKLLKMKFKSYQNFEKKFYPKVIKKFKSNYEEINGFWYSVDNVKDINSLNLKNNNPNYKLVNKIRKSLGKM